MTPESNKTLLFNGDVEHVLSSSSGEVNGSNGKKEVPQVSWSYAVLGFIRNNRHLELSLLGARAI